MSGSFFYRPPTPSVEVFSQVSLYFHRLCINQFSNFIVLGDFNVNVGDSSHPYYHRLGDFMSLYCLSQVVNDTAHTHHNGVPSIIDLPTPLIRCCTIPPLANSDHNGLGIAVKWNPVTAPTHHRQTIWRYACADWNKARELITACNWESLLTNTSPHGSTSKRNVCSIMDQYVPKKALPPGKTFLG